MWFKMQQLTPEEYKTSRYKFVFEGLLPMSAEKAFDCVIEEEYFKNWLEDYVSLKWLTDSKGLGSKRQVNLKTLSVKENFLIWERGERLTFAIYEMTLPLLKSMMEDYIFEPLNENSTKVVWTVYYEPNWFMQPIHPIARAKFGGTFSRSFENLKKLEVSGK